MGKPDQESAAAEEARRATGDAAGRGRGGRLSARRKRETVLRLLRGEDLESVSRELGITAARAAQWRDQFLAAGQASLKSRAPDAWDEANRRLQAKIGERSTRRWTSWRWAALWPDGGRGDEGRPLDLHAAGVWRAAGLPRVAPRPLYVYARRQATPSRAPCRRRGPVGAAPDDVLAGHIRRLLEASPFHGEG